MRLILLGLCSVVLVQAKFPLLQRLVDTKQCQGFTCPGSDFGTCCPVEGWYCCPDGLMCASASIFCPDTPTIAPPRHQAKVQQSAADAKFIALITGKGPGPCPDGYLTCEQGCCPWGPAASCCDQPGQDGRYCALSPGDCPALP